MSTDQEGFVSVGLVSQLPFLLFLGFEFVVVVIQLSTCFFRVVLWKEGICRFSS